MIAITQQIQRIQAQGIAAGKIGIIYKENKYGDELALYFKLLKNSILQQKKFKYSSYSFCKKNHSSVKIFKCEHDIPYSGDELLFEILHYDFSGAADRDCKDKR